jgi:hypothetical protein
LSYATTASFPATGANSTLYLSSDTSKLYRWESTLYVEVASVATSVSAADLSGTLPDASLSANVPLLPGFMNVWSQASTNIDVVRREACTINSVTTVSGRILFTMFTPAFSLSVSQIQMYTGNVAASGLTLARMGLFTWTDSTQTATLLARTASDTTLFNATVTLFTRSFDTTGGYPANYTLSAGTRYAIGVIATGTTMPQFAGQTLIAANGLTPRLTSFRDSQTDLVTTIASPGNFLVYARLS